MQNVEDSAPEGIYCSALMNVLDTVSARLCALYIVIANANVNYLGGWLWMVLEITIRIFFYFEN